MSTSCPFDRNWPHISASRSQATTLWYSVRSRAPSPRNSLVAIVKLATGFPEAATAAPGRGSAGPRASPCSWSVFDLL